MSDIKFNRCQVHSKNEESKYCVYRHINPQNGKVYVGITGMSLIARWKEGKGYKKCKLFYRAIQKYGWNSLQHCVVCRNLNKETAHTLERHLIQYYKSKNLSYNITDGGEGTSGFVMPEEAKQRISAYLKEAKCKPVLQYSIRGEFIREYKSATEAAKILGFGHASVINCASGMRRENTLHGYLFVYKNNAESLQARLNLCKDHWRNYKILQYKDNNVIGIFNSFRDAERKTKINHASIRLNIEGKLKHAGGYIWRKVREEDLHGYKI